MQIPGEILVMLDTEGRLVSFRAVPPQKQYSSTGAVHALNWTDFFSEAGLNMSQWTSAEPQERPLFFADSRAAWQGRLQNWPDQPARIEAASLEGKPIGFATIGPWSLAAKNEQPRLSRRERVIAVGEALILIPAILGGIFFARRNLRLGRGDRRRANRLGLFALGMLFVGWMLSIPRVSNVELLILPYAAGLIWILYIAIEPFVRRRWPQVLVSWTRLLSGDWIDPRVGRDVLVGCALGVLINYILRLADLMVPFRQPAMLNFEAIIGIRNFVSALLGNLITTPLLWGLGVMCFLFLLMVLLRNEKAVFAVFILVSPLTLWTGDLWSFATGLITGAVYLFVLMRFGLLAIVVGHIVGVITSRYPASLDASAWYSGYGYLSLAILAAIVLYAFRTSLGGRLLLSASPLDD
jgi:hypothetical protein